VLTYYYHLGSTGTAKWAPYRYRVRRGYVYRWGTAACVPQAYPISAKKKISGTVLVRVRYGSGTGRAKTPPFSVNLNLNIFSLTFLSHSISRRLVSAPDSLSSTLCLSLPPPPVSSVSALLCSLSLLSVCLCSALGKRKGICSALLLPSAAPVVSLSLSHFLFLQLFFYFLFFLFSFFFFILQLFCFNGHLLVWLVKFGERLIFMLYQIVKLVVINLGVL
jgi:hypothetical protein